jgi:hypothetical protein
VWKVVAQLMVTALCETGVIRMDLDDTTFHKSGRKIVGASWWRDAVRSTGTKVVHCFGLNVIVSSKKREILRDSNKITRTSE